MTTTIKERPILFSAPMVRAILDGRKTMTRRIISHVAGLGKVTCFEGSETEGYDFALRDRRDMWNEFREDQLLARCPYGVPGSQLWVRETFRPIMSGLYEGGWDYRADDDSASGVGFVPWKPSIFMPRQASRITLRVEAVRVERLQEITEADALSEGVASGRQRESTWYEGKAVEMFRDLWDKINGPESWDANPFVWCVSFSVVKP